MPGLNLDEIRYTVLSQCSIIANLAELSHVGQNWIQEKFEKDVY